MPIYEFHCQDCQTDYETRVERMGQMAPCPQCGGSKVERLMSASAIHSRSSAPASPCASGACGMASSCPAASGANPWGGPPPCAGGMCGL